LHLPGLLAGALSAAEPSDGLVSAQRALADGLPAVAAVRAERQLATPKLAPPLRQAAAALAAESWVRAGEAERGIAVMDKHDFPAESYWRARTLAMQGDTDGAKAILETISGTDPLYVQARMLLAYVFLAEGREVAARKELKELRDESDPQIARHARLMFNELEISAERSETVLSRLAREQGGKSGDVQFLRAKASLEIGDAVKAEALLRDMLDLPGLGERLHDAAVVMLAEALLKQGDAEAAREELVAFIESVQTLRETSFWGEAFDLLAKSHSQCADHDSVLVPVVGWITTSLSEQCRGYAMHLTAHLLSSTGRKQEALGLLEASLQLHPVHRKAGETMRLAMELHGGFREDDRVLALAGLWRERFGGGGESVVDSIAGEIFFQRGDVKESLSQFMNAAGLAAGLAEKRRALFNAAVVALHAGEEAVYRSVLSQIEAAGDVSAAPSKGPAAQDTAADLKIEAALQLAAKRDAGAEAAITDFLTAHPDHPRVAEAEVALAELCLLDLPPRVKPAEIALDEAAKGKNLPAPMLERIAYVRMWLKEAAGDLKAAAQAGESFLEAWPQSGISDQVRMKVAHSYFRLEDYPNARTQFETLASEQPDSPFAEAALFFAAKAAMAVISPEGRERAVEIWQELAEREGSFAIAARMEHAHALRRDEQHSEALLLVENLLAEKSLENETRLQLTCEKLELLLLLGAKEPKHLDTAVSTAQAFLKIPGLPYLWAARGGWLLSQAYQQLGRTAEALEACYAVVDTSANNGLGPGNAAEYRWFYMAGFDAVTLLEQRKDWDGAAKLAEKLSKTAGDQADDAKKRANDIRLKHFLWDAP
jgi:tetratricopeptide (TPR) repeat protein